MSRDAVEQMVGRAVVDREFRAQLLAYPSEAAKSYLLSEIEQRLLGRIRAESLADFARILELMLDQPPFTVRRVRPAAAQARRAGRASA